MHTYLFLGNTYVPTNDRSQSPLVTSVTLYSGNYSPLDNTPKTCKLLSIFIKSSLKHEDI